MIVDLSITVSKSVLEKAAGNEEKVSFDHLGTHFDVMNKEFPLSYLEREGIVFDVSSIYDRDIDIEDIDISKVQKDMFVAFYSGYIETEGYGTKNYFSKHPQLSNSLIDILIDKEISIIGIDFAGIRRGKEHTLKDQACADRNVFVVENLCNFDKILAGEKSNNFTAHTYPIKFEGLTGLPCRVIGKIYEDKQRRNS